MCLKGSISGQFGNWGVDTSDLGAPDTNGDSTGSERGQTGILQFRYRE